MRTAVDTNVLFDLLAGEVAASQAARAALSQVLASGPVAICPVVYAELAAGFPNPNDITRFLHDLQIGVVGFSADALFEAAAAWKRYATRRDKEVQRPGCGHKTAIHCPSCQAPIAWRQPIISDFLVGGHALHNADRLLTRDVGYYRAYFPSLSLLAPAQLAP